MLDFKQVVTNVGTKLSSKPFLLLKALPNFVYIGKFYSVH